jgi:pyruvate carboxylase
VPFRPGDHLPPADLAAERAKVEADVDQPITDQQLASALMYPKVTRDFLKFSQQYSDVSVVPTPTFFYGMKVGDEVALNIESGKTLLVVLQSVHDDDTAGLVRVQFELNGQSRMVTVPRAGAEGAQAREVAQPGNPLQVGAPMPGSVVHVAVAEGQHVKAGATLLSMEAMKMETHVQAERDGVVERVLVKPGDRVGAKDLLIVFAA